MSAVATNNQILLNELQAADGLMTSTSYKSINTSCSDVFSMKSNGQLVFMLMYCSPGYRIVVFNYTSGVFKGTSFLNQFIILDF